MKPAILATLLLPLLSLPFLPAAAAQGDPGRDAHDLLYTYTMEFDGEPVVVEVNGEPGYFHGVFRDASLDPPVPVPGWTVIPHAVDFQMTPLTDNMGWTIEVPSSFTSYGSTETPIQVGVQVTPMAREQFFTFNLTAIVTSPDGMQDRINTTLTAQAPGLAPFAATARPGDVGDVSPRQQYRTDLEVFNGALVPRYFTVRVMDNPCAQGVAVPDQIVVDARSIDRFSMEFVATEQDLFYVFGTRCEVKLEVAPLENPAGITQSLTVGSTVYGTSLDVPHFFWLAVAILVLAALVLLAKRRKERLEEEILGKPQKPWTIPVEQVYLKHLRRKDERAWYTVRHHLMEEEHRSAMLWYAAYKQATRGARKKERHILREEHRYEAWKRRWQRRLAKPLEAADRLEAALQRKLDRRARSAFRKERRKVAKLTRKMRKTHEVRLARRMESWEKTARKAEKKGQPPPPKPEVAQPDYPPEPVLRPVRLADHRWARKAQRFRARQVRRQGDLEVRFERADARRLQRMRRKAQRLGRRLDDPEFVRQHPLLQSE